MSGPVLPAFSKLSGVLHRRGRQARLDSLLLRLHYRVTTVLLLLSAFVVSTRSLAGDPIECTTDGGVPRPVMNTYCYIAATHSVAGSGDTALRLQQPAGLGQGAGQRRHAYYQWVPFMLTVQALFFYLPYAVWKHVSGRALEACLAFQLDQPDTTAFASSAKLAAFAAYFSARMGRVNQGLVRGFFLVELVSLVNVVGNVFLLDAFLGCDFSRYAAGRLASLLSADDSPVTHADAIVFPPLAKCTFRKFGVSGTLERIDATCVLPHNVFNEKLFVALWLWLVVLAAASVLHALVRITSLAVPRVRRNLFLALLLPEFRPQGRRVFQRCTVSDWFLLCNLAKNMDRLVFSELVHSLASGHGDSPLAGSGRWKMPAPPGEKPADRRLSANHVLP